MKRTNRALRVMVLAGLLAGAMYSPAALAAEDETTTSTDRGAAVKAFLRAIPAESMLVMAMQDLENLDFDVMYLTRALGLPAGVLPSGLAQYLLGSGDEVDMSGVHGMIVLDAARFQGSTRWKSLHADDVPVLLAISAKDPEKLLQLLGAEKAEGCWTTRLLEQQVFAVVADRVVLFGPDRKVLLAVTDPAQSPAGGRQINSATEQALARADAWMLLNIRQMVRADELRAGCLMGRALTPVRPGAPEPSGISAVCDAALTSLYVDLLAMQMDDLAVTVDVGRQGAHVAWLLTYPQGSLLGRAWSVAEASKAPPLAGLPAGNFLFAGSMGKRVGDTVQMAWDLAEPMLAMMGGLAGKDGADWVANPPLPFSFFFHRGLHKQQEYISAAGYSLSEGGQGVGALACAIGCTDLDKTWSMLQRHAQERREYFQVRWPELMRQREQRFRYVEAAEKVELVPVDHLFIGRWTEPIAAGELAADSEPSVDEPSNAVVKILLGEQPWKVRIARKDGRILGTVEGGTGTLQKALAMDAAQAAPLANDSRIRKAAALLPKERDAEGYLAADAVAAVVTRAVGEWASLEERTPPKPWPPRQVDVPMALSVTGSEEHLQADLYMPAPAMKIMTDLGMWASGYMVTQIMAGHGVPVPAEPSE